MSLVKWRKPDLLPSFSSMVENFFRDDDDFLRSGWFKGFELPAVNVQETEETYTLEVAAPGLKKDDFNIEVKDNTLIVSSEMKEESEEKEDNYTRKEFSFKSFRRSFWLPDNVDANNIDAEYADGVLKIRVPKREKAKPENGRKIKIS